MATAVNDRSAAVTALAAEWPMIEALMGGTRAMRAAGEALMPKFPSEEPDAHKARLQRATLFPAYRRTITVMASKPFSEPLTLGDDVPPEVLEWADDIDREGVNLHTFAAEVFFEALAYGLAGILVDAPKRQGIGARPLTKAEQAQAGVRPYFVRVKHSQILGWRVKRVDGKPVLTQLRLRECSTVEDGQFGEREVDRVRVLEPGKWTIWQKVENPLSQKPEDQWVIFEQGQTDLDVIPFVPAYGWRKAFMEGAPPLIDLAYMNVKHWQSQSDQDNILHVARVPILFAKGFQESDAITVGASTAIKTTSENADMKFVEHTGQAIGAGEKSLDTLEQQMIQAGAELLVKKAGARSATESANDAEANKSDLQRIAEGFEDTLDQALYLMARLGGLEAGGHVKLFKDFGAWLLSEASGQLVLSMEQGSLISKRTAINEMKRRGELAAEVDAEEEIELIDAQGPALGAIEEPGDPAVAGA